MFSYFISAIRDMFNAPSRFSNVEAYIIANNPQTVDDIDRLEREYFAEVQRQHSYFYR